MKRILMALALLGIVGLCLPAGEAQAWGRRPVLRGAARAAVRVGVGSGYGYRGYGYGYPGYYGGYRGYGGYGGYGPGIGFGFY